MRAWRDSLLVDHAVFRVLWDNLAEVVPGKLYRSNHPTPCAAGGGQAPLRAAHLDQPARPSPVRVGRAVPPGVGGTRAEPRRHGVREPGRPAPRPHPALRRHLPHAGRAGPDALQIGRRPGRSGVRPGRAVRGRHQPGRLGAAVLALRPLEPVAHRHPGRVLRALCRRGGGPGAVPALGRARVRRGRRCGGTSSRAACRRSWWTACWCGSSSRDHARLRPVWHAAPPPFRAPPPEGPPDLDGRPGEPARSTLPRWLQTCRGCAGRARRIWRPGCGIGHAWSAARPTGHAVKRRSALGDARWRARRARPRRCCRQPGRSRMPAVTRSTCAVVPRRCGRPAGDPESALRLADVQRRAGLLDAAAATLGQLAAGPGRRCGAHRRVRAGAHGCAVTPGVTAMSSAVRPPSRTPHVTHGKRVAAGGFWSRFLGGTTR